VVSHECETANYTSKAKKAATSYAAAKALQEISVKVLALTRAPGSACEYYRGIGTLSKIPGVEIRIADEVNWTVLSQVDILFAERQPSPSGLESSRCTRC